VSSDEPDTCKVVEIDGQPVHVRGQGDLTAKDREMLAEVIAAAQRKLEPPT
jgi:hypothetical protein